MRGVASDTAGVLCLVLVPGAACVGVGVMLAGRSSAACAAADSYGRGGLVSGLRPLFAVSHKYAQAITPGAW